jgi:uncharacterized protein (DUF58 family)
MLKQQDSVGLITFSNRIESMVPPKATSGHLFAILKELENKKPEGETSAGSILQELAGSLKRKGLLLLVSDLLDKPEDVIRGLKQLRSKGNDILVFHILDRDELEFPFKDPTLFLDMEEEIKLLTDPYTIRPAYLKAIHTLIENYRAACTQNRMDYSLLDTSIGLDRGLVRYLKWREKFR